MQTETRTPAWVPESGPFEFGEFTAVDRLGTGGMAEVWRGRYATTGAPVVIKVMRAARCGNRTAMASFQVEAEALSRLSHPLVVTMLSDGLVTPALERASAGNFRANSPYLVLESAPGMTLGRQVVPATWNTLRRLLLMTLRSLAHIHRNGVIHRDVKPNNIIIDPARRDTLQVIDYGLSLIVHKRQSDALAGAGTPAYSAPEQMMRSRADRQGPWTDLYSLGCTAFRLASGRLPFRERSRKNLIQRKLNAEIPALVPRFPVPRGFHHWLWKLMNPHIARRPQSALDAASELNSLPELKQSSGSSWRWVAPRGDWEISRTSSWSAYLLATKPQPAPLPRPLPVAQGAGETT